MYQLQGINFDIENVNKEDSIPVPQLIRETTPYLQEAGLIISLDSMNTVTTVTKK